MTTTSPWEPIDVFTPSETRNLVFESHMEFKRRTGSQARHNFDLISNVIETYKNLPFNPDSLIAPSSLNPLEPNPSLPLLTLNKVARDVLRNQFVDFGNPDHLALIRLSGWNVYILGTLVKIVPPNKVVFKPGTDPVALYLAHQLWFIRSRSHHFRPNSPPIRTYKEIVALSEEP